MRQETTNTFNEGMIKDLTPLVTPNNVLTDALNATLITFNGNEFQLQNDMGNCKVERAHLSVGFIPVGMKEYGGIVYVASYNPETGEGEVGSFPSPERDFSTNDFPNLSPANFNDSQFILNTGTPVNEKTSVIKKLIEPELLQLNPGDKYVVVYTIHDPGGSGTKIIDQTGMDAYISKDVMNRKLFKLKFYKISDDNNLSEINSRDIKVIENQPDIEDEYVYFKENSKGTIAVGLETETLDLFEANVIDTSRRTVITKTVAIEAIGYSNSLADFKGVKVDVQTPEVRTFYIEKGNINRKVSAIVSELIADSTFACSVTPYSAYSLFPKLKKDFQIDLGKYASVGPDTNNIFRYRVDTNFAKVDFDYKFSGDADTGLHLYVEFYDPWSDYSVIKTIDNPTYYGINSFVMELIDEPVSDTFDSTNRGGTSTSLLITNPDTTYERTQLNTSNLIRTTATLRKNHFYIVRISGVDVDRTTAPITYRHYDLYKAMYTNDMFNSVYDIQNSIPVTSPQYVADFTSLNFDLSAIKYGVKTTEITNINVVPVVTTRRDDLTTNGRYYKISATPLDTSIGYKSSKLFKTNKVYSLDLSLSGTDRIFGTFKENLLNVTTPTLNNSSSGLPNRPTIVDNGYDNDPRVSPLSYAEWSLNQINSKSYQLSLSTETTRSVYADVATSTVITNLYKEVPMLTQFYYRPNGDGIYGGNRNATLQYSKYGLDVQRPDGSNHNQSTGSDDGDVRAAVEAAVTSRRPGTSALLLTSQERTWFYDPDGYHDCGRGGDASARAAWKQSMMLCLTENGDWQATRTHDLATIVDFWNNLFVASSVRNTFYTYFPTQDIRANNQINTVATYPGVDITTNFNPTAPGVKTYLSTIMFKAISDSRVEFNTASINNYIATRLGDSIIIDNKKTIRDGFIPYITDTTRSVNTVQVDPISIIQSADNSLVAKYAAGESQVASDPALLPGKYQHKQIYTKNPNYEQYLTYFVCVGNVTNIEITPQNVQIRVTNGGFWMGKHSNAGDCAFRKDAVDMVPNIMITKT